MPDKNQVDWSTGKEVHPELPKKKCEAEDCDEYFVPDFPPQRRCYTCRLLKRPYKSEDLPF